jgi:hypothetical protein
MNIKQIFSKDCWYTRAYIKKILLFMISNNSEIITEKSDTNSNSP